MVTKRQLGILLAVVGVAVAGVMMVVDRLGAGEWGGFGPLQWIGLGAGVCFLMVGITLYQLGDRPA